MKCYAAKVNISKGTSGKSRSWVTLTIESPALSSAIYCIFDALHVARVRAEADCCDIDQQSPTIGPRTPVLSGPRGILRKSSHPEFHSSGRFVNRNLGASLHYRNPQRLSPRTVNSGMPTGRAGILGRRRGEIRPL